MKNKETCCLCNREIGPSILGARWCTMEVGEVCNICDDEDPFNPKNWPDLRDAPAHVIERECKRHGYKWY